jgi:hypothetical protein
MAVSTLGKYSPLLDFIGLEPSAVDKLQVSAITYQSVEGTAAGTATIPWQLDACAARMETEWGGCTLTFNGFGRLSLQTISRDFTRAHIKQCEISPFYLWNGQRVDNELQWDMATASSALVNSLHKALVVGNRGSSLAQFEGLQRLIKTGYVDSETGEACTSMDSIVINYNSNIACPADASPPSGVTWNGVAMTGVTSLMQVIERVVRHIAHRINMSNLGGVQEGNMIILCPGSWIDELLDCYTCMKYCAGNTEGLKSTEARAFRDSLMDGGFGQGLIRIGGMLIPILGYDHEMINAGGTLADIYILTNTIGNQPLMRMQYNDMRRAIANLQSAGGSPVANMVATDNGKLLITPQNLTGTCTNWILEMQPRLVIRAPWAQCRITNVARSNYGPVISADPTHPYYVEQNLVAHVEV